jgi:hypothetical protein
MPCAPACPDDPCELGEWGVLPLRRNVVKIAFLKKAETSVHMCFSSREKGYVLRVFVMLVTA